MLIIVILIKFMIFIFVWEVLRDVHWIIVRECFDLILFCHFNLIPLLLFLFKELLILLNLKREYFLLLLKGLLFNLKELLLRISSSFLGEVTLLIFIMDWDRSSS